MEACNGTEQRTGDVIDALELAQVLNGVGP